MSNVVDFTGPERPINSLSACVGREMAIESLVEIQKGANPESLGIDVATSLIKELDEATADERIGLMTGFLAQAFDFFPSKTKHSS